MATDEQGKIYVTACHGAPYRPIPLHVIGGAGMVMICAVCRKPAQMVDQAERMKLSAHQPGSAPRVTPAPARPETGWRRLAAFFRTEFGGDMSANAEKECGPKEIETVILSLARGFDERLFAMSEEELRADWHWRWIESLSAETNLYYFTQSLEGYRYRCRRWEEHHNGCCCVVERVRDKYLMPRIKEFMAAQQKHA